MSDFGERELERLRTCVLSDLSNTTPEILANSGEGDLGNGESGKRIRPGQRKPLISLVGERNCMKNNCLVT
jgi:hypothetical protein